MSLLSDVSIDPSSMEVYGDGFGAQPIAIPQVVTTSSSALKKRRGIGQTPIVDDEVRNDLGLRRLITKCMCSLTVSQEERRKSLRNLYPSPLFPISRRPLSVGVWKMICRMRRLSPSQFQPLWNWGSLFVTLLLWSLTTPHYLQKMKNDQ